MLANLQKKIISEKILKLFYQKGTIPTYSEFLALLNKNFRWKEFGKPFFIPRGAARNLKVDPQALKDNVTEIRDDLSLLFQDTSSLGEQELIIETGLYGEIKELKYKLMELSEEIDAKLLNQYNLGNSLFFDNFRNTDKIDLSRTSCYIDTSIGYASLPADASSSVRLSADSMKLINEAYSSGYKSIGSSFLSIFSDYLNETWQALLPNSGFYQAIVNITGGDVVEGHSQEAEINKISVDPLTPLTLNIDYSVDGVNWTTIASKQISSLSVFEFDPVWVLFLRFTVSGSSKVGIRRVEIGKIGTIGTAELVSKALISPSVLYSMNFQVQEDIPYGTKIDHFIAFSPDSANWQQITEGPINIAGSKYNTITFGASADFSQAESLVSANILLQQPIQESGKLQRGFNQVKVEAFGFNWDSNADPNHIPDISDWSSPKGQVLSCYMGADYLGTDAAPIPASLPGNKTSFIYQYSNSQQDYWAVAVVAHGVGPVLTPNYNYKITTYLYSDRNFLLNNAAGGLYAIGGSSQYNLSNAIGWSLYINGNRIAYDNKVYCVSSSPGSGIIPVISGKSFPVSIQPGWNKIELLVYMPTLSNINNTFVNPGGEIPLVLLFRPNIFNFTPSQDSITRFTPQVDSYPIWADGSFLKRVSKFYLQWNVPIWNRDYWAWNTDPASGIVTGLLLNYNPASKNFSIDGTFSGSNPNFLLTYTYIDNPAYTIYYKAVLSRTPASNIAPKLYSYKFLIGQ